MKNKLGEEEKDSKNNQKKGINIKNPEKWSIFKYEKWQNSWSSICIRLVLYNTSFIYLCMGKRGPKSKFTDVVCPNVACKDYGVAGHGNIMGNGTYQARNTTIRRYICHSCGKAFCDSTNTVYYNLRKDESTIDLALNISMKGMSNESTAEVLRIQPATIKRWLALAAKQCDKVNATLMKNLNVQRIEMDELWVIIKKK